MTNHLTQADMDLAKKIFDGLNHRDHDGFSPEVDIDMTSQLIAHHVQEAVKAETKELIEAVKSLRSAQKAYISYCKWGEACSGSVNKETKEELGQEVAKAAEKVDEALGKEVK